GSNAGLFFCRDGKTPWRAGAPATLLRRLRREPYIVAQRSRWSRNRAARPPHADGAEALRIGAVLPGDRLQGAEACLVLLLLNARTFGGKIEQCLLPHHHGAQVPGAAVVELLVGQRDDETILVHRAAEREINRVIVAALFAHQADQRPIGGLV